MTIRERIADWLTGGSVFRLRYDVMLATAWLYELHADNEKLNGIISILRRDFDERGRIIASQRAALDQIDKDLTDLIKMPQYQRDDGTIRAIRAITKV